MTNAQKYLKDELFAVALWTNYENFCEDRCLYNEHTFKEFMEQQAKIELTEDERVILRNLKIHYTKIGREKLTRDIFIADEPDNNGIRDIVELVEFKDSLFQFIKERRRI